jgi:hypothetical protein
MKRGSEFDGVFMDTVDTVDVYPEYSFQQGMVEIIKRLKEEYPTKAFCSNRGFSVLDDSVKYCDYVMFETFYSEYDWINDKYYKITDEGTIDWNDTIHKQLERLRKSTTYEVVALNYCSNTSIDDKLREDIYADSRNRGYISWSSTILLNEPLPNMVVDTPLSIIKTNAWEVLNERKI